MKTIGIISGKGGVGKTTVSINLAYSLSKFNKKVCLVDLNLTTPHVSTMLSLNYDKNLTDYLKNRATELESIYPYMNFWIMPASLKLESLEDITINSLHSLKRDLGHFEFLVLDSAPGFGKEGLFPLFLADELLIVSEPTYSSLIDTLKAKQIAEKLGRNISGIILNKVTKGRLNRKDFEEVTKLLVIETIELSKSFHKAETNRIPVASIDKKIEEKFDNIARKLLGLKMEKNVGFFDVRRFFRFFRKNKNIEILNNLK